MSAVVLGVPPSVQAASQSHKEALGGSTTALENTRDRVESGVAAALVRDAARLTEPVILARRASRPRWFPGEVIKVLDGQHGSSTAHRLKAWRSPWAAPLPGPAVVVVDQQRLVLTDVFLREDGHAQERSVIPEVLHTVHAGDLWIADRHVCPRGLLCGMARRGAAFLVRPHGPWQGEWLGTPTRQGGIRSGTVSEHARLVRAPEGGEPMTGRRMPLKLKDPTRDGETERHLLSHGPGADARAGTRAMGDGTRWSIETALFASTTTLAGASQTGGSPKAALLACCLALLADNAVSVITAAWRRAHGGQKGTDEVSGSSLALEMRRTYDGMMMAIPAPHWAILRDMSAREFADALRALASAVPLSKDRKPSRGPQKKPPQRTAYQNGSHVSTAKLIAQR